MKVRTVVIGLGLERRDTDKGPVFQDQRSLK